MKDVASKKSESASEAEINLDVPLPACKQHPYEDKSSTSSYIIIGSNKSHQSEGASAEGSAAECHEA